MKGWHFILVGSVRSAGKRYGKLYNGQYVLPGCIAQMNNGGEVVHFVLAFNYETLGLSGGHDDTAT